MIKIGIIKEGKSIPDTRVPLTPEQCKHILEEHKGELSIIVQSSPTRCYSDEEYKVLGIPVVESVADCDILLGVKEVPIADLIPNKTYFYFSHTIKKQPYNKSLLQAMLANNIKMIDYETLTYDDGSRIIGFGFFAGVVGAHNGLLTYGKKHNSFHLTPAYLSKDKKEMMHQAAEVVLPPVRIVVTGSGKVANGIVDILHAWDIVSIEPQDFLDNTYNYPVYTHLKGHELYVNKDTGEYHRAEFHSQPEKYECLFHRYFDKTDILMHGIFWNPKIAPMFTTEDVKKENFKISVISDITCDPFGSIPINVGASTIPNPVYGIDKQTLEKTAPYLPTEKTIDIMAVDNLPNELPRDASEHFGDHMIKYIIPELFKEQSAILERATICADGKLTPKYEYLRDYAYDN
jgi:saccharopine dehydrogenase (NAD+, L-lysine-forming)